MGLRSEEGAWVSDCPGELELFPKRPEESGRGRQECPRHGRAGQRAVKLSIRCPLRRGFYPLNELQLQGMPVPK